MRKTTHKITFEEVPDSQAAAMAAAGVSVKKVMSRTHLTKYQALYRAEKVRRQMGMAKTLRQSWREGEGWLYRTVGQDIINIAMERIRTEVTPKLVHPTPETVKVKE